MTAASERVRDCWDRACNLAGFEGAGSADPRSIGAQIDATVEVLSVKDAMRDNGFGPQEPKSVFDATSKPGPCSGCDSRGECAECCPGLRAETAVRS